tara:strand:+ start:304 stop:603 length:300 start_codon:yes stop_codon:yes gene_type:complete
MTPIGVFFIVLLLVTSKRPLHRKQQHKMNNSSTIIRELQELRKVWRDNNFNWTKEQQARYDELLTLRKAFIAYWEENGLVWKGPSNVGKATTTAEEPAA